MAFKDYVYESDTAANSYLIRLDTDQATLAGAVVGVSTDGFHIKVNKNRRSYGLHPREITLRRVVGTAPNEKTFFTRLAICTKAAYDAINVGSAATINGINYVVATKTGEFKR
jgi:hypothetical protein